MKGSVIRSAITHETQPDERSPGSAFQRFAQTMHALVAVPKHELDQKLAEKKAEREVAAP
jgi:hypothetical protein